MTRRRRVYEILEGDDTRDRITAAVRYGIITVVLMNVFLAIIETMPQLGDDWYIAFRIAEAFSFVVFLTEYLTRIWACVEDPRLAGLPPLKARLKFMRSADAIIDLIAILPFFVSRLFPTDLRTLALLRLLRIMKLMRYSAGINSLFEAIWAERHTLVSCLFILLVAVITSATLIYLAEGTTQPKAFGSIPLSMWWAIVTLTTVGYGDVVPITPLGRMIGAVTVIMGLIVLALPIAVVATSFAEVLRRRGFLVNWATLSRLPLFAGLDSNLLGEILSVVRATSFDAGDLIQRRGDPGTDLYVIAIGDAEIETEAGRDRIGDGAMFGGPATPETERADLVVRALTRTRVLIFAPSDLEALMRRWPTFAARIRAITPQDAAATASGGL